MIKCNHGCGYNILCPHEEEVNQKQAVKRLNQWMKKDYWKEYCETQYKFIKKKILIEEYLGEKDYYIDYFEMEWNHLPYTLEGHGHYPSEIERPIGLEKMVETAKRLSEDFPFVRVDLYNIGEKIYLSELTFIPTGGFMKLQPENVAEEWGSWLEVDR